VVGWDPDPAIGSAARDRGGIDELVATEEAAWQGPHDLVVFAGPPAAAAKFVSRSEVPWLTIDTAGAKGTIVGASNLPHFVGTHPMAGREVSGPEAATESLFNGATWVITTDGASEPDIAAVESVVATTGARTVRMTAAEHDAAVAAISHLPDAAAMSLAAGSFRDLTRVAGSDTKLWLEVLKANRDGVLSAVTRLQDRLGNLAALLAESNHTELGGHLDAARDVRRSLAARATAVRIALADRPGELAKVGVALSAANADVRDIQLRHAPYGGGGVLTISVRPGDAATLTDAILAAGLVLA
jgi:prephenate dehydrogenase